MRLCHCGMTENEEKARTRKMETNTRNNDNNNHYRGIISISNVCNARKGILHSRQLHTRIYLRLNRGRSQCNQFHCITITIIYECMSACHCCGSYACIAIHKCGYVMRARHQRALHARCSSLPCVYNMYTAWSSTQRWFRFRSAIAVIQTTRLYGQRATRVPLSTCIHVYYYYYFVFISPAAARVLTAAVAFKAYAHPHICLRQKSKQKQCEMMMINAIYRKRALLSFVYY